MKTARILDLANGSFGLEYDNNLGKRNTMRLDSMTYEKALEEARSFLGIDPENVDPDGTQWEID